ncbi:MAG: hypothetical protein HQM01_12860 [Magnetococcales bacterium]|nr:hypothetical protein [Magnetococcales bacterium]
MIARPQAARWLRLLAVDDDLPLGLETLARTAPFEPEAVTGDARPVLTPEILERLKRFDALVERFRLGWPEGLGEAENRELPHAAPLVLLDQALMALEAWRAEAEPLIQLEHEQRAREAEWLLLRDLAGALGSGGLRLEPFGREQGDSVGVRGVIHALPLDALPAPEVFPALLTRLLHGERRLFLLAVGREEPLAALAEQVAALHGRPVTLPEWASGTGQEVADKAAGRLRITSAWIREIQERLLAIGARHGVAAWIQAVRHLKWYFQAARTVGSGQALHRFEGWVAPGIEAAGVNERLRRAGVRGLASLSDNGPGDPPLTLVNPWWARPFERFPRLLGMPGRDEVDPSRVLAVVAPLLFGYMFGDVGQGAVLFGMGVALRRHFEAAWLLMSGGVASIFFGFLFGSLFSSEAILPALWLHPTAHPLAVLAAPLAFGAGLILTGLGFSALGAHWRGHGSAWWRHEGGVVLIYLGALLAFFTPIGYDLALLGLGIFVVVNGLESPGHLPARLAHLLETVLQLGVNTFSFARVGAFALAHAGLSQAVMTLADLAGGGVAGGLVLLLGNGLILALEGLVVSVQTTRLILFEFFVRFLSGGGRPFRPLPPPD